MVRPSKTFLLSISRYFWLAGICLLIFLSGCTNPAVTEIPLISETATPTFEPSPTIDWFPATPTPTATPREEQAAATPQPNPVMNLGEMILSDDFSDSALWRTIKTSAGNVVYGEKALSLAVVGGKGLLTSESVHQLPQDFYLEISASVSLCQYGDQYGLLFWQLAPGDSYRLVLTCDGRLRMELLSGSSAVVLQDWTVASKMMPGAPTQQQIGLWAKDGELQVFINGTYQFSVNTNADRAGGLGVFARAAGETAVTVGFADLKVYRVK
ncbi:MAG: hypothetical protein MUO40_12820 [Anaerolineaceae bacterium]|nr:hypothetical protein [Anaerolineaceae bacterium]